MLKFEVFLPAAQQLHYRNHGTYQEPEQLNNEWSNVQMSFESNISML